MIVLRIIWFILFIILFGGGILALQEHYSYEFTTATVTDSKIRTYHFERHPSIDYKFKYEVDGEEYTGTSSYRGKKKTESWSRSSYNNAKKKLVVGNEITVKYIEDRPDKAFSEIDIFYKLIALYGFVIVGILFLLSSIFPRKALEIARKFRIRRKKK